MLQDNELVQELISAARSVVNVMRGQVVSPELTRLYSALQNLPDPPGRLADPALIENFERCDACKKTPWLFRCKGCENNARVIERLNEKVRKAVDALLVYRDLPKDHWPGPPTTALDELAPVRQWTEECKLQLSECPFPELDGLSIQNRVLSSTTTSIVGIGNMSWNTHYKRWQCLANVNGMLCLVELDVCGIDKDSRVLNAFEVSLKEQKRAVNPS